MDHRRKITEVRILNIIDMAVGFTAMLRVFGKGSNSIIQGMIREALDSLVRIRTRAQFESFHARFCRRFSKTIRRSKRQASASYGQGAKVLDITLKVCVHYCALPSPQTARRIRPFLHMAIDTPIMEHLKRKRSVAVAAHTIGEIGEVEYGLLQQAAAEETKNVFNGRVTLVELDDVLWRRLNRG